jgi:hypothetical protein
MQKFKEIVAEENLREFVKVAFNADLEIDGAWGYTKELATIISKENEGSVAQIEFTLATMRAYLEMNMTVEEEERYGAFNLMEVKREVFDNFDKVTYEISAMKERDYKRFIAEYKEKNGEAGFNMSEHFNQRKKATLKREVIHWFKIVE